MPAIDLAALQPELSDAHIALGRVDSICDFIPNPDLFVYMYVRKEAVLSSQIEGTQASLSDLLEYEAETPSYPGGTQRDVDEIVNYLSAMNHGLDRLTRFPLSVRLLNEIHEKLLAGTRGNERTPGHVRTSQNWIGPPGSTLKDAAYIPPPPHEVGVLMSNLERYLHNADEGPALVRAGIAHAQFETIHPFLDGNGRLGRLLITFLLCEQEILAKPLLYLSVYLKKNKEAYYDWLMRVRFEGDWEGWLRFFLRGVIEVSEEARQTARNVLQLQQDHRALIREKLGGSRLAPELFDRLFLRPVVSVESVEKGLSCSRSAANMLVGEFESIGILKEITGRQRDRVFRYQPYMDALTPD